MTLQQLYQKRKDEKNKLQMFTDNLERLRPTLDASVQRIILKDIAETKRIIWCIESEIAEREVDYLEYMKGLEE